MTNFNYFRRREHVRLSVPASLSHTFRHFSLLTSIKTWLLYSYTHPERTLVLIER